MKNMSVRERILKTTDRLFYEQGYRATGINQIIKESEVAKASFYHYFPSKEMLCLAYLTERSEVSHERQKKFIAEGGNTPKERICGLLENIRHMAQANHFNGCPFLNIASEINEKDNRIRHAVKAHKSKLINLIKNELKDCENSEELAETVYVIYEGTNISVKNYQSLWPVDRAEKAIRKILAGAFDERK